MKSTALRANNPAPPACSITSRTSFTPLLIALSAWNGRFSLSAISRNLEERGAITDARIFRIGAEYADRADNLKFGSYMVPAKASMSEVLEAITASGKSTCGRDLNYRIRVTKSDVVLSALDLTTNTYAEVARFDAGADPLPPEYLEVSDDPALVLRVTVAEGVTSWQIVDADIRRTMPACGSRT